MDKDWVRGGAFLDRVRVDGPVMGAGLVAMGVVWDIVAEQRRAGVL